MCSRLELSTRNIGRDASQNVNPVSEKPEQGENDFPGSTAGKSFSGRVRFQSVWRQRSILPWVRG